MCETSSVCDSGKSGYFGWRFILAEVLAAEFRRALTESVLDVPERLDFIPDELAAFIFVLAGLFAFAVLAEDVFLLGVVDFALRGAGFDRR
ncbi:hypothetical protein EZJ49_06600 [Bdellovibrio bacteriovorus]|uniref:hypothetical protein n=1 Tax=Bdellovibrio bacteriovorus TaxID=959 RepID=UPI0021D21553|nr:hypothetical protein [Bdellovibrio bacteriovorus]UXR65915.1 hypothetical protein EZJ49_06600 [Bdellovibrio bacteriovorus]